MCWLYVPDMEASNWDLNKSLMESKPFALWRGNALQPNTLSKKWTKEPFMMRLSGLTLEPSKANLGVEKWILLQEDSHANPIQVLASNWPIKTHGTFGPISSELLGKCDQDSYSLKTFQASLNGDLTKLCLTSINWGILVHGVLSRLPTLEPCTEGNVGSSLVFETIPTPTTQGNAQVAGQYDKRTGTTLAGWARAAEKENWPTPTTKGWGHAAEGQVRNILKKVAQGTLTMEEANSMMNLDLTKHRTFKKMFPTPMAREPSEANNSLKIYKEKGREKDTLTRVISGEEGLTHGGRLNPQWVAWLMGLPIGWINSEY